MHRQQAVCRDALIVACSCQCSIIGQRVRCKNHQNYSSIAKLSTPIRQEGIGCFAFSFAVNTGARQKHEANFRPIIDRLVLIILHRLSACTGIDSEAQLFACYASCPAICKDLQVLT